MDSTYVISGLSGRYPEARNLEQFWSNLMAGRDCATEDSRRWPLDIPNVPKRMGKISDANLFDGEFFNLSNQLSDQMYVSIRLLHEVIYETLIDAGFIPTSDHFQSLAKSKTGIFLGDCCCSDEYRVFEKIDINWKSYHKNMLWLTQSLNLTGPILEVDTACASGASALNIAIQSIRAGHCDQAIVAGYNYCMRPQISRCFKYLEMVSMDGKSKCLDENANGYCRSESIVAMLIQRKSNAKRIYASILHVETNCDGYTVEGITFPKVGTQCDIMASLFKTAHLNPLDINYVEGHITGTQAGDTTECETLLKTMRPNSDKSLLIGCVKSNIGHSEGAAALNAISKVVKIFQTGIIPPNIHFKKPNSKIEGLVKGILKPVLSITKFEDDLIPVTAFGYGGVNQVVLLKANQKKMKESDKTLSDNLTPRLVNFSNRTYNGLETISNFIEQQKGSLTKYTLALLNDMSKITPSMRFNHRGYLLLNDEQTIIHKTLKQNLSPDKMSPWFVFTTMFDVSSQSFNHLMNLPLINSRLKLMQTNQLTSHGIDIIKIIESNQKDLTNFLISSIAIQIALCDLVVKHLGIKPKGIIGHSIGLIAAAYADNCITDEDALLIGYHIGEACKQFKGQGAMVCVNLPWEQVEKIKPDDVEIASHESKDWTMVTGEKQAIENFIKNIDDKVKTLSVDTRGIPFGSSLLSKVSQLAEVEINKLIKPANGKKLLSSSFPKVTNNLENGLNSNVDAKFFTKFLHSPCYLHEIKFLVPLNTLNMILGSSPNLKASNENSIKLIDDSSHKASNRYMPIIFSLYKAFGQMYLHGLNPLIENLYDSVEYPVPRETQPIGHLIKWKHDRKCFLPKYETSFLENVDHSTSIDLVSSEWSFLSGHKIDGRILLPATGYLYLAWKMICYAYDIDENKQPIELFEVNLHRATQLKSTSSSPVKFFVNINRDLGTFELQVGPMGTLSASGKYRFVKEPNLTLDETTNSSDEEIVLDSDDIYKEFRIRGYDYIGSFQGVEQASSKGTWGMVKDTGHWISFADSCCQVTLLASTSRKLIIPTYIEYAYLHPSLTMDSVNNQSTESDSNGKLKVSYNQGTGVLSTKGFVIKNILGEELKRKSTDSNTKISIHHQFPFDSEHELSIDEKDEQTKYSSYCLELIKLLNDAKSNKIVNWNNVNAVENDDRLLMDGHESKILSQTLLEMKRKIIEHSRTGQSDLSVGDEIDSINKQYKRSLMEDDIFKKPLSILFDQMINIIQFNHKTGSNLICVVNFRRIPSEISFNNLQVFGSLTYSSEYYISPVLSNSVVVDIGHKFDTFDVIWKEGLKLFKIIVVRDKSTYLMLQDSTPEEKCNQFDCDFLRMVFDSLEEGGFCMILTRSKLTPVELELQKLIGNNQEINFDLTKLKSVADEAGFTWICCKQMIDEGYCSVLLRRPFEPNPGQKISFIRVRKDKYDWIDKIKEAGKDDNHKIWLIGGGHENGLTGLTKSLLHDPHGYNIRCYYDPSKGDNEEIIVPEDILVKDLTMNQVDADGKVGMFKSHLVDISERKIETSSCYADVKSKGDLSSLRWFQSAHSNWNHIPHEKLIVHHDKVTIYYSALNFKDILVATGRVPLRSYVLEEKIQYSPTIGLEYSGIDSSGNRIMGLTDVGGIGTSLVAYSSYAKIQVPDEWTLAEAATVPVVYLTAYYGLITRGNMRNGESVLIHAGSGGVGQAAISICLARGCEVFTTVGTQEKRDFIKKRFPSIDDDHIGDSRSTSFEDLIMRMTNGRGVDLVLNSLSDDKLTASVRCLNDFGRFIEIGKYDMVQNTKMNSNSMDFNKTFHACCLAFLQDEVLRQKVPERIRLWRQLIIMLNEGIKSGEVVPLPSTVFKMNQLEESFRFMATGKHIGKVLIQMRDETEDPNVVKLYPAIGQTFFDLEKSYIITGGLGGLGLEVAFWMVQRGATNLILTSRSGVKTKYQEYMLDRIRNNNYSRTNVLISHEDCYTYESAERLINQAEELGPVGGTIFSALVLNDSLFANRTAETFTEAVKPKSIACEHLDKCTRSLPYKLDYFVGFSSIANEFGNVGQDNYCYGNAAMENICFKRRLDGHPGLTIRWGPIGDVGTLYASMTKVAEKIDESELLRLPSVLNILDKIFCTDESIYTVFTASEHKSANKSSVISLKQQMLNILGIRDVTKVDPKMSLGELGLDSLMVIEIRQILESDYDCSLTTQEIRDMKISEIDRITIKSTNCQSSSKTSVKNQDQQLTKTEMFVPLNKVETGQSTYFYFPNIDEIQTNIESLFESLSIPVVGVNYVKDSTHLKEIEDIIDFYVNLLLTNYPNVKSYNLIGHSIGGAIALKVAIGLQKKLGINFCKNLIILDTVPEIMISNDFGQQNDENNDKTWMVTFLNKLINSHLNDQIELTKMTTPEERYHYTNQMSINIISSLKQDDKFNGDISLISLTRTNESNGLTNLVDCGLAKNITGQVQSFNVTSVQDFARIIEKC